MDTYEKGSWVFLPHDEDVWVPAQVVDAFGKGEPGKVVDTSGKTLALSGAVTHQLMRMDPASRTAHVNLESVGEINEASILHNIRLRFKDDKIYTKVGSILISVNPYRYLPLYTPDVLDLYKLRGSRELPPHVYGVADDAWHAITSDGRDQAIVVGGESGSGKTEVTKLVLQYLAEMSGGLRTQKEIKLGTDAPLQEQLLRANPLLEAFGNARTVRNDNSSRFGRWTEILLNRRGNIIGGSITQYLLEKSRVVEQAPSERNYHVFYQLLAGGMKDAKLKTRLKLGEPDDYYYLNQGLWTGGPSSKQQDEGKDPKKKRKRVRINDDADWEDLNNCMTVLGISQWERNNLFQYLSAILHLGNIRFDAITSRGNEEACKVGNPDQVALAAWQLGCVAAHLEQALVFKQVKGGRKGDIIMVARSAEQAEDARDALAKSLYGKVFAWLIDRINYTLETGGKPLTGPVATSDEKQGSKKRSSISGLLSAAKKLASSPPSPPKQPLPQQPLSASPPQQPGTRPRIKSLKLHMGVSKSGEFAAAGLSKKPETYVVGLLDIFGFESLDDNSYEQLCINYGNEKLQSFFNSYVLELEQAEYQKEGVKVPRIDYSDNSACITLFEASPQGIFAMLEDEARIASGTDSTFLTKVLRLTNPTLSALPAKDERATTCFIVKHFAGAVTYDVSGILDKNAGSVPKELVASMRTSTFVFSKEVHGDVPFGTSSAGPTNAESADGSLPPPPTAPSVTVGPDGPGKARETRVTMVLGQGGPLTPKGGDVPASPGGVNRVVSRRTSLMGNLGALIGIGAAAPVSPEMLVNDEDALPVGSLASQFVHQLDDLLEALRDCDPHFIRCIKPNDSAKGGKFDAKLVTEQLTSASILPITRIRQAGFPMRLGFEQFNQRFRALDPRAARNGGKALIEALASANSGRVLRQDAFRLGKTKIFMRTDLAADIEQKRNVALTQTAILIQKVARGMLARVHNRGYRATLDHLVKAMLTRDEAEIDLALSEATELPYNGRHIDIVQQARLLQVRFQEEERILNLLRDAIKSKDPAALQAGLAAAHELKLSQTDDLVAEARSLVSKLAAQREVREMLISAVASQNPKDIAAAMSAATKAGATDEAAFHQCVALKSRVTEVAQITQDLERAVKARDVVQINDLIARALLIGVGLNIAKARTVCAEVRAEEQLLKQVEFACEQRNEPALKLALAKCDATGLVNHETIKNAREFKKQLDKEIAATKAVAQASVKGDSMALKAAVDKAASVGVDTSRSTVILDATRLTERVKFVQAQHKALKLALQQAEAAGKDGLNILAPALLESVAVGLDSGNDYEAVIKALKALGKKGEQVVTIADAMVAGEASTLESLFNRALKDGFPQEALQPGLNFLEVLENESMVSKDLIEAMGLGDIETLAEALEQAKQLPDFNKRHHYIHEKGKAVLNAVRLAAAAVKSRDMVLLQMAIDAGAAAGAQSVGPVAEIEVLKQQILSERDYCERLVQCGTDVSKLRAVLADMPPGIPPKAYDVIVDAKSRVERDNRAAAALKLIEEAASENDMDKLNKAIFTVIELGLTGKQFAAAFELRSRLEAQREIIGELLTDVDMMRIRLQSRDGIHANDLRAVQDAIAKAKNRGLPSNVKQLRDASVLAERMQRQLLLQEELDSALKSGDFNRLKLAMNHAQEQGVDIELAAKVRAAVRTMDAQRRAAQRSQFESGQGSQRKEMTESSAAGVAAENVNDPKQIKEHEARLARAGGVRYKWERFNDFRSDEDWAKGTSGKAAKAKLIELKFTSQTTPILKSLIVLDKNASKQAAKINKAILGYCGDKIMSFSPSLARDILQKGLDEPALIDEIYCQLCKHSNKNPKADSLGKVWQLICMAVSTFPPSADFEPYLLNFLAANVNVPGLVGNYARFALRRLEGMLNTGPSGFVPSIEEIAAYKERPPILATIELVDGTPLTTGLPITPDLDCNRVVDLCLHFLNIKDPRAKQTFAIFVVDETEKKRERAVEEKRAQITASGGRPPMVDNVLELIRTNRPLTGLDFLGNVIVQMTRIKHDFTFCFKRKLHLGAINDRPSDDPIFRRLLYLQAQNDFIYGDVPMNNVDEVASLISLCVAADNEHFPENLEALLDKAQVISYVPRPVRRAKTDRDWAKAVMACAASVTNEPSGYLQDKFVDQLRRNDLFGALYFYALRANDNLDIQNLPSHVLVGVNSLGVHIIDADNRRRGIVRTFPFELIKRWGGSAKYFSFSISNGNGIALNSPTRVQSLSATKSMAKMVGAMKSSEGTSSTNNLLGTSFELAFNMPQASDLSSLLTEYVAALGGDTSGNTPTLRKSRKIPR